MRRCLITQWHKFHFNLNVFYDMVAIDETQLLLASDMGLLKTTKNEVLGYYYSWSKVISLCPLPGQQQLYLLGLSSPNLLIVWSEASGEMLFRINEDRVSSIKRVMPHTNHYIIQSCEKGVQILTIEDVSDGDFYINELIEAQSEKLNHSDSLQL